uniref:Ribosomal protein L11 n=1 Tax=Phaeophyceae sp. TaxID=2249243 RepID=A0A8E5FBE1_9PHAE|nr:ribosomal protein L11 [Phaeophyceae sp.]
MKKEIISVIKLALLAGKAIPAPPVGPALSQHGVNISAFCKDYNLRTKDHVGLVIPVEISIFKDKSYSFILKTVPTSNLLRKSIEQKKGSSEPKTKIVGLITQEKIRIIAENKLPDLNTTNLDSAVKIITGTAVNMGIKIIE